jgi:hypothetical protein
VSVNDQTLLLVLEVNTGFLQWILESRKENKRFNMVYRQYGKFKIP